jgi:DNA-binding NarL/FixJ family response regulator
MNNNLHADKAALRTIVADDHTLFCLGLRQFLTQCKTPSFHLIEEAKDGKQALALCNEYHPDLLILDMNMPEIDGLGVLASLAERPVVTYKLVLCEYSSPKIVRAAIEAGADGYLLKSGAPEELHKAVAQIQSGETFLGTGVQLSKTRKVRTKARLAERYAAADPFLKKYSLTKRELEILQLITQAMSNKEIGKMLYISDQTVSVHRKNIMRKLGVSNTAGLIKAAYDFSLV